MHFKVGALRKRITLAEDTFIYNSSAITRLIQDLNTKLATAFPQTPTLHNIAGSTWTKYAPGLPTDGSTVTLTQVSTYVFNYVVSSTTYTITFTAFDMNNGSAQFTESDGASLSGVRTFNLATGRFDGSTIPHDWIPPSNFYWQGIYPVPGSSPAPAVVCSQVFPQLTIAPGQANGFFKLLTDFDLKQTAEGNPGAETITRTNLQSANAFLVNEMLHSNQYTQASAHTLLCAVC